MKSDHGRVGDPLDDAQWQDLLTVRALARPSHRTQHSPPMVNPRDDVRPYALVVDDDGLPRMKVAESLEETGLRAMEPRTATPPSCCWNGTTSTSP